MINFYNELTFWLTCKSVKNDFLPFVNSKPDQSDLTCLRCILIFNRKQSFYFKNWPYRLLNWFQDEDKHPGKTVLDYEASSVIQFVVQWRICSDFSVFIKTHNLLPRDKQLRKFCQSFFGFFSVFKIFFRDYFSSLGDFF